MSVVEILISSTLMLLLLGSTLAALVAGKERAARSAEQGLMEEEAIAAISQVTTDLSETNLIAINAPTDQFLVMPLPRNVTGRFMVEPNGKLRWSTLVAYRPTRIDDRVHLLRQIADLPDSVGQAMDTKHMTPTPDVAFFTGLRSPTREVARGFERLEVTEESEGVKVALEVSSQWKQRKIGLVLQSFVKPRN